MKKKPEQLASEFYNSEGWETNLEGNTLDADKFQQITRWGKLHKVLDGIAAAKSAGLAIKINAVALKDFNEDEFDTLLKWCGDEGFDLTLIETMPMGDIGGAVEGKVRSRDSGETGDAGEDVQDRGCSNRWQEVDRAEWQARVVLHRKRG